MVLRYRFLYISHIQHYKGKIPESDQASSHISQFNNPPTGNLAVNSEARLIALAHFSHIPTISISNAKSASRYPAIYKCAFVNYSIDIFSIEHLNRDVPQSYAKSLQNIQILKAKVNHLMWFGEHVKDSSLEDLPALKELEFTISADYSNLEEWVPKMINDFDNFVKSKPEWIAPKINIVEDGTIYRTYEAGVWSLVNEIPRYYDTEDELEMSS